MLQKNSLMQLNVKSTTGWSKIGKMLFPSSSFACLFIFFKVCIPHTNCTVARLQATFRPFPIKPPVFGSASQLMYHPETQTMTVSHTFHTCVGAGASHPRLFASAPRKEQVEKFYVTLLFFSHTAVLCLSFRCTIYCLWRNMKSRRNTQ